jgi:hypothetical protein
MTYLKHQPLAATNEGMADFEGEKKIQRLALALVI